MREATHEITAGYFPKKGEVDLTWEDLKTHEKVELTAKVDHETGMKIANVVWPCVYNMAVVKETSNDPNIVPYTCEPRENPRKAYIREKDLANGGHIRLTRFTEPGSEGSCGINLVYLSPEKDGKRTELKFALSDEAATMTCLMLQEFFGCGVCA